MKKAFIAQSIRVAEYMCKALGDDWIPFGVGASALAYQFSVVIVACERTDDFENWFYRTFQARLDEDAKVIYVSNLSWATGRLQYPGGT